MFKENAPPYGQCFYYGKGSKSPYGIAECFDIITRSTSCARSAIEYHQHDLIDPLCAFYSVHFGLRTAADLAGLRSYRVKKHIVH